jgi:hypothetical protein
MLWIYYTVHEFNKPTFKISDASDPDFCQDVDDNYGKNCEVNSYTNPDIDVVLYCRIECKKRLFFGITSLR